MTSVEKVNEILYRLRAILFYLIYISDRAYYIQLNWRYVNFGFRNTKDIKNLSIIGLRLSNLFLMELMLRYEKMALLWFRILRDFSLAKEFVGCSWVSLFNFSEGTIHKVLTLEEGGTGTRQKRISVVFMMPFYCLKAYKGQEVWKSPNLSVHTLWMVPKGSNLHQEFTNF